MKLRSLIKDKTANIDMILTAVIAGILLAVSIAIVFGVVGGINYDAYDNTFRANQDSDSITDTKTTGINHTTVTVVNLTRTPRSGSSSFTNVSQYNSSTSGWVAIPSANYTYSASGNNVTVDAGIQDANTSRIQVIYNSDSLASPSQNASDSLIVNLNAFYSLAPIYIVVIATVGIIAAVLLIRGKRR